jgi:two-component system, OmpR family, phosphate regulon sensor histidine kinase PhoR
LNIRGVGDGYAIGRLLWLLVGMVIVPTILLSLFGVMAIRNHRATLVQRVRQDQQVRLQELARTTFETIAWVDEALQEEVGRCGSSPCQVDVPGLSEVWIWQEGDPVPLGVPEGITMPEDQVTQWFSPVDSAPVGARRMGPLLVAFRLDMHALKVTVGDVGTRRFPGATFDLEEARPGPASSLSEMIELWNDPAYGYLVLERPLERWRLVLHVAADDDARAVLSRTSWLLPVGLVFLVTLVLAGAVVTLTTAAREIRLSRLQTDFVSSVSHELRTPLTSIRMFVETLQTGRIEDPKHVDECLELLAQETDRLSRMIERVLNWARMEAGRRIYEFEIVSPRAIAADAVAALRSQTLGESIEVFVDVPEGLPTVRADRDAIVEALLNLLQNALKFTAAPRRIELSARESGSLVGISVRDNGPGIARRHRRRIFEKFYQADARLSSPAQSGANRGSGLGLSIVRAVVRGHGGQVELHTEIGHGSCFTIWLPTAHETR